MKTDVSLSNVQTLINFLIQKKTELLDAQSPYKMSPYDHGYTDGQEHVLEHDILELEAISAMLFPGTTTIGNEVPDTDDMSARECSEEIFKINWPCRHEQPVKLTLRQMKAILTAAYLIQRVEPWSAKKKS